MNSYQKMYCAIEALECRQLLATLYVATSGNDTSSTPTNPSTPYKTIQKAATVVNPGDTVIVSPGVYYGPINLTRVGTAGAPIVFKTDAVAQNRVVITNANKNIREKTTTWTLVDATRKMYTVPMDHWPARVLYDGVDLLPYQTLAGLQAFKMGVNLDYPGTPSGYFYDSSASKLYVRLRADGKYGSVDPNQHTMAVAPVSGGGGKGYDLGTSGTLYNFGITTQSPAYVTLDGFSFETPGVAGVYVRGSNVTVRNAWFRGVKTGVAGRRDNPSNDPFSSDNVIVENSNYSQFPAYDDAVELIHQNAATWFNTPRDGDWKFFWWQRKGQSDDKWLESTFDYESPGITEYMGKDWIIRNNHIADVFDGIGTFAMEGMDGAQIYNNVFERIVDNGIEFENRGKNIQLFNNEFYNVFMPISWQPLGGTPWPTNIWVYKNLIHESDDFGAMWKNEGQYRGAWLKIGAAEKQWDWYAWMANVPKSPVNPGDQGIWFYNNTIVTPKMQFLEKINSGTMNMEGVYFYNNAFVCEDWYGNYDIPSNYWTMTFSHNLRSSDTVMPVITENRIPGTGGVSLRNPALVGFTNYTGGNYSLTSSSPARGLGVAVPNRPASEWSTDAGAIPFGSTWVRPTVGPQGSTVTTPTAPTGLFATAGNAQVALVWAASAGALSYNIRRATVNGGPYTTLVATNLTNTNFTDTGLTNGTTYYYVVTGVNGSGEGSASTQASAIPQLPASPPAAPSALSATSASTSQINLLWTDNAANETGFEVDYSTSSTFASGVSTITLNTPNLPGTSVTGLNAGTLYYFRVRATSAAGGSANSNTAGATTQAVIVPGNVIDFDVSSDYTSNFREVGGYTANIGWESSGVVAMAHSQNWRTGVAIYDTTPGDGQTTRNNFGGNSAAEIYSLDFRVGATGLVKLFARLTDPSLSGGYYLMADMTSSNRIALRVPTTAASPDNENDLASTNTSMAAGTWYTLQLTVQNNPGNTAVTLTGKLFPQGSTIGTPLATVTHTHSTNPYIGTGQTGFASTSSGIAAPGLTTNVDNFTFPSAAIPLPGDANGDGQVNSMDFSVLAVNFNLNGRTWAQGDFSGDGRVNALDFNSLASNYGQSGNGAALANSFPLASPLPPSTGTALQTLFNSRPIESSPSMSADVLD